MRYAECVAVIRFLMRKKQLLVALLVGGVAAFSSAPAFAQTSGPAAALTTGAVVLHYLPDGTTPSSHPNGSQPSWISNSDCQQNIIVRVPITMTNLPTSDVLQVWAGANGVDCTQSTSLTGPAQSCWPVISGGIAPVTATTIDIKAQDIVAGIAPAIGAKPQAPSGTTASCSTITQSGPIPITLFFIFINGSSSNGADTNSTDATYGLSVAMIGPAPPTNITVADGDTFLKVDWTPTTDSNTQGFQLFCDPPPGKEPEITDGQSGATVTDSSTVEVCNGSEVDGGFDDEGGALPPVFVDAGCHFENVSSTSTVGGVCVSNEIVPGGGTASTDTTDDSGVVDDTTDDDGGVVLTNVTPPPANIGQYSCGPGANLGTQTSSEAILSGLKNGVTYVVGVAAYDVVGNIGPMGVGSGANMCGEPAKGLDFFDVYKQDGGGAGGGFCSFDKTQPVGTSAFAIVGLASLVSIIRRRNKNKSKTSRGA
jgi:hypothetical protein